MKFFDSLISKILAVICLSLIIITQIVITCKILLSIFCTFIYITGVMSVLFAIIISLSVVLYLICKVYLLLRSSKHRNMDVCYVLDVVIMNQVELIFKLTVLCLLQYTFLLMI
ncbi:hypothetical protein [Romboutsia weinsteinii]|uniref:hypothetical protein n=1 Tax=Romboutsia weinsteinii TaxID=2020949 RepID=UPI0011C07EE9|nr:hypothetical protein [Romboutsia weinsteinii]